MPHSPDPWVAWFDYDEDGRISQAGVDTADRAANVAVTTCENVEVEDLGTFNEIVQKDTWLLAAAPELLAACEEALARIESDIGEDCKEAVTLRTAIAKAEGKPCV